MLRSSIAVALALAGVVALVTPAVARRAHVASIDAAMTCNNDGRCIYAAPANVRALKTLRRHGARHHDHRETHAASQRGLVTIHTAAGPVTVAPDFAPKISGFIGDVVARGFSGRVKCFSLSKSHVPGSLHFSGNACDFAQRGWNKTVAVMYRVRDLAAKWGLRDGCSFRDCGHIDSGQAIGRGFARRHHRAHIAYR
ncbi:MAG: hypothetical protein AB7U62_03055 [Pseudolabrys sp.]